MLRNRKCGGFKFVRQYPFTLQDMDRSRFVVVDFYCHAGKLAIELDGAAHGGREKIDKYRENLLAYKGIRFLRFKNDEVFTNLTLTQTILNHLPPTPPLLSFKRGVGGEFKGACHEGI